MDVQLDGDILVRPDDPSWIVVPNSWPFAGFASAAQWAQDESARRIVDGPRARRAWLADVLTRIADSTREQELLALYLPDPTSDTTTIARLRYALSTGEREATLRDLVVAGDGVPLRPPALEAVESPGLGRGYRSVAERRVGDEVMVVRAYAFRAGPFDLRVSSADPDEARSERLADVVRRFVDSISVDQTASPVTSAEPRTPVDWPATTGRLRTGTEETWYPVPAELVGLPPMKRMKRARTRAGRILPKRAMGVLEPLGLDTTTVLLGVLAEETAPSGDQWFIHRPSLPNGIALLRVRWYASSAPTDAELVARTRSEPGKKAVAGDARRTVEPAQRTGPGSSDAWIADVTGPDDAAGFVIAFPRDGFVVGAHLDVTRRLLETVRADAERLIATIRIEPGR